MLTIGEDEYRRDPETFERSAYASDILARRLKRGTLALVLGAGSAADVGLPLWHSLVARLCEELGVDHRIDERHPENTPVSTLLHLTRQAKKPLTDKQWMDLVEKKLYEKRRADWILKKDHATLRALGTLLMGSRTGTISDVVTYNFDDTLESYVRFHGLMSQSIARYPTLIRDTDVRIYHPHGYLPMGREDLRSDKLVFDRGSYADRASKAHEDDEAWHECLIQLLRDKQAIFVGLSGEDPLLNSILPAVKAHVRKRRTADGRYFVGYWLFGREVNEEVAADIRENYGCAIVRLPSNQSISQFLFRIRQKCLDLH